MLCMYFCMLEIHFGSVFSLQFTSIILGPFLKIRLCAEVYVIVICYTHIHPAGTSIISDICDLSKISDIAPLTLGSMEKSFFITYFVSHRKPISVKISGKYIYRKI